MEMKNRRKHDIKFKECAVQLSKDRGNIAAAARELGIGYSLLNSWIISQELAASRGKRSCSSAISKATLANNSLAPKSETSSKAWPSV